MHASIYMSSRKECESSILEKKKAQKSRPNQSNQKEKSPYYMCPEPAKPAICLLKWLLENLTPLFPAVILRVALSPAVQTVPWAIGCTADQAPLAHCWKELPPIQFHSPSVVQAPVKAPAVDVVGDVVPDGAAAGAEEASGAAADDADGAELATGVATTDDDDAALGELPVPAPWANTPPELLGEATGDEALGVEALLAELSESPGKVQPAGVGGICIGLVPAY